MMDSPTNHVRCTQSRIIGGHSGRLRCADRREAARRGRPDRPLPDRRAARPAQRRRALGSKLRPRATPPPRPRRQPPAQRRLLPDRDHPGPLPPRRARLPRTKTSRREKPPRSDPLSQTPARPRRLQHTESESRLDIGATLAHLRVHSLAACASAEGVWQPTIAGASWTSSSFSRASTMNRAKSTRRVMLLSRMGSPTCRLHTGRP